MNKLKTLKDLEESIRFRFRDGYTEGIGSCILEELKQEAIKDIKYLQVWKGQNSIKLLPWITTTDSNNTGLNAIIEYIKWKNNITEEDLK